MIGPTARLSAGHAASALVQGPRTAKNKQPWAELDLSPTQPSTLAREPYTQSPDLEGGAAKKRHVRAVRHKRRAALHEIRLSSAANPAACAHTRRPSYSRYDHSMCRPRSGTLPHLHTGGTLIHLWPACSSCAEPECAPWSGRPVQETLDPCAVGSLAARDPAHFSSTEIRRPRGEAETRPRAKPVLQRRPTRTGE